MLKLLIRKCECEFGIVENISNVNNLGYFTNFGNLANVENINKEMYRKYKQCQ